ncbi:hypothetical protein J6590_020071 [Homalodisca vitripennis]|nr:hypothetical protein J6590_020071 [Homalodisca vitripennis]
MSRLGKYPVRHSRCNIRDLHHPTRPDTDRMSYCPQARAESNVCFTDTQNEENWDVYKLVRALPVRLAFTIDILKYLAHRHKRFRQSVHFLSRVQGEVGPIISFIVHVPVAKQLYEDAITQNKVERWR